MRRGPGHAVSADGLHRMNDEMADRYEASLGQFVINSQEKKGISKSGMYVILGTLPAAHGPSRFLQPCSSVAIINMTCKSLHGCPDSTAANDINMSFFFEYVK